MDALAANSDDPPVSAPAAGVAGTPRPKSTVEMQRQQKTDLLQQATARRDWQTVGNLARELEDLERQVRTEIRLQEIVDLCIGVHASPSLKYLIKDARARRAPTVLLREDLSHWKAAALQSISQYSKSVEGHFLGECTEVELDTLLHQSEGSDGIPIFLTGKGLQDNNLRAIVVRLIVWSTVSENCYKEIRKFLVACNISFATSARVIDDSIWRKCLCWFVNCTGLTARLLLKPLSSLPDNQITCLYLFLYQILWRTGPTFRSIGIPGDHFNGSRRGHLTVEEVQETLGISDIDLVSYLCTLYLTTRSHSLAGRHPSTENLQNLPECSKFILNLCQGKNKGNKFTLLGEFTSDVDRMERHLALPNIRSRLMQCLRDDRDPTTIQDTEHGDLKEENAVKSNNEKKRDNPDEQLKQAKKAKKSVNFAG